MPEIACISELWVRVFVVYECVLIKWHAASKGFFYGWKHSLLMRNAPYNYKHYKEGAYGGLTVTVTENSKRKRKYILHSYQWWLWWVRGFCVFFFLNTFCFFCFALCCFKWILYICCCNYINSICSVVFSLYKREVCFGMEFWLWFVAVGT